MTIDQARRYYLKVLRPLCAVQSSFQVFSRALAIRSSSSFSWYDSIIVASALESGCDTLYSEDMQDGRQVEGLLIK